jgi:hypothetical protein
MPGGNVFGREDLAFLLLFNGIGLTVIAVYLCARAVYRELFDKREHQRPFLGIRRTRGRLTVALVGTYFLTIYLFAVIYGVLSRIDSHAFDSNQLYLFDAVYMSLTTATTIGSEIHPKSHAAKGIVMLQLVICLTYGVMFFSLVATVARDSGKADSEE